MNKQVYFKLMGLNKAAQKQSQPQIDTRQPMSTKSRYQRELRIKNQAPGAMRQEPIWSNRPPKWYLQTLQDQVARNGERDSSNTFYDQFWKSLNKYPEWPGNLMYNLFWKK